MIDYEHHCRSCDLDWRERYGINDPKPTTCPECKSEDIYRCVTTSGAVHFKGAGWSPDGYNKHKAYDAYGKKNIKLYDRKEDLDRDMRGEAQAAELKKLKRLDRVSKRHLGRDAGVTQAEADRKIKAAGEKAVK